MGFRHVRVMSQVSKKKMSRVRIVTLPPLWIEVGSTSTFSVAVQFRVALFAFPGHALVVGVVAFVSAQEEQIAASSTIAAQLTCRAVDFFVPRVVAQTLPAPCGDRGCGCQCLGDRALPWWWYGKPFELALWRAVTVALAVGALAWWSSAFRALFAAVFRTAALPATSASRLVMQLRHFERSSGSKTKGSVRW